MPILYVRNDADDAWIAVSAGASGDGIDTSAIHDDTAGEINAITEKTAIVAADLILIEDSEDSNNKKKAQADNIAELARVQTAFSVHGTAGMTNFATNTYHDISFDTEHFDLGSDFNTTTYTYTAPVDGNYFFLVDVRLDGLDSAATGYRITFVSSNRSYHQYQKPQGLDQDVDYWPRNATVLAYMDASDTMKVQVYQQGGTAQTDIIDNADYHWFCGFRVSDLAV